MKPEKINEMTLRFVSRSANEGFARAAAAAFIAQLDPTVEQLYDIKTAVSEAVTNAIVHGYRDTLGTITVTVRLFPPRRRRSSSGTRAAASPMWPRPGSLCSPPAGPTAPGWALPSWRASWTSSPSAPGRERGPPW